MPSRHVVFPILIAASAAVALMFAFDSPDATYWTALRQNLAAEVVGFLFGAVLAAWVAWGLARERIARIGQPLIQLVAQLRVDNRISGAAARSAVILTARVLGDDEGIQQPRDLVLKDGQEPCDVCGLTSCFASSKSDGKLYCDNCGLPDGYWKGIKIVMRSGHSSGGDSAA